ncbi:mCpol domain-containing protein [Elioraea tepidiphila]|jgi:GTP cyclohydrolase III|uniref:mCpol domain-containing protein n=1 Tax=Elioraea tepidiphila TaxID=457934 RepID=UPI0012ECA5D9
MEVDGNITYYSFDGDQIGRRIQTLILENAAQEAAVFSRNVSEAIELLTKELQCLGCQVLFAAGDSVMAVGPPGIPIERLLSPRRGISFSVGIGKTPRDALVALSRAKINGGGHVVCYREL